MSEMNTAPPPPSGEGGGGGSFFTQKYYGIPGIVWLGGAAVLAYFLFFRNKSSSSSSGTSTDGAGGEINIGTLGTNSAASQESSRQQGQAVNRWAPVNNSSGGSSPQGQQQGPQLAAPGQSGYPWQNPGQGSMSGTPNPQPTPWMMSRTAINAQTTPLIAQPSSTAYRYYTAQPGDTLSGIAGRQGISALALAQANNLKSNGKVNPGQVLKIPLTNSSYIL